MPRLEALFGRRRLVRPVRVSCFGVVLRSLGSDPNENDDDDCDDENEESADDARGDVDLGVAGLLTVDGLIDDYPVGGEGHVIGKLLESML